MKLGSTKTWNGRKEQSFFVAEMKVGPIFWSTHSAAQHSTQVRAFKSPQNQLRLDKFAFCLGVAKQAWLAKVGFAVCLYVHSLV